MAVPGMVPLVTVMDDRADRAAAVLGGGALRMDQVVRRPRLIKATRAAAVWEVIMPRREQAAVAAVLVRRAQMRRRVKEEMEGLVAHPASQIHPSPMQAAAAVRAVCVNIWLARRGTQGLPLLR